MTEEKTVEEEWLSPGVNGKESSLQRLVELTSSLISLSHSSKVFPSKWQLIRLKLDQLNSSLLSAKNCSSDENSLFSNVVQSIESTVIECHDLARRCIDHSYSGKLLMQSDLDVMSSKIDIQLKDLGKIYTTGIMAHAHAIVVSRPGSRASREDMKFYVQDLYTRMKIGDLDLKNQALISLNEILQEDDRYVKIVAEAAEFVGLLVNLLENEERIILEESTEAISTIAGFDSCKGTLVEAGSIASLIRVLETGSNVGKERAARALQKLTENSDNAWSVSAHGGVTLLLRICSSGNSHGELIGSVCGVLKNLTGVDEIKRFMVEEGAIKMFLKLVMSIDKVTQISSIELLQNLASGDEPILKIFITEGGIQSLVHVLDPNPTTSLKIQDIALRAIDTLCLSSTKSLNILLGTEFLSRVMSLMQNADVSIQLSAVKTAFHLCEKSEETKRAIADAGFIPELVSLLDSKSFEIREMAAEALSNLLLVPRNRKRFMQEDSSVAYILQLLDPENQKSGIKDFLLSILMSLTNCNTGRRKIANSGFLKHLEKLAEAEVTEAKRIMKRLSENRFRSIFNGIWHS